jgi:hypothetical protein
MNQCCIAEQDSKLKSIHILNHITDDQIYHILSFEGQTFWSLPSIS